MSDASVEAPSAPLEDDIPRLAQRGTKLYLDWKTAFAEAGTDCAAATARMNALADANADVIEANRRVYRDRAKVKALREELAKYDAENDANAKAIIESPTMKQCFDDPAFSAALDRLGGE